MIQRATGLILDPNSKPARTLREPLWKTRWNPALLKRKHLRLLRKTGMPWRMTNGIWTGQLFSKGLLKLTYEENGPICTANG